MDGKRRSGLQLYVQYHERSRELRRTGRPAVPWRTPTVRSLVDGRRDEHQRGRLLATHTDVLPQRRRTEHAIRASETPTWTVGDPLEHRTVPRTTGKPRRVRLEQLDRGNDRVGGSWWRSVHGRWRQVLSNRPIQRDR